MNAAIVEAIAKSILYEGYLLYPYRPSAIKNRQRFNFGVLYPREYSVKQGGTDAWTMRTQCLVQGDPSTGFLVRVRFLRMVERSCGRFVTPQADAANARESGVERVDRLETGGRVYQSWQEAVEGEIELTELGLGDLASQSTQWPFRFSAKSQFEIIRDDAGRACGFVKREQEPLAGVIEVLAERLDQRLFRLTIQIQNTTGLENPSVAAREEALSRSLVSTHTILGVRAGEFVSLVDPPEQFKPAAASCENVGTFPVLVGEEGQRDTLLSSPIILYDYPQVALESPGDLFDGAEIDEILSLRIMTMTDEEKREARESDEHARQILERTENLPAEHLLKLHGVIRGLRPKKGDTS